VTDQPPSVETRLANLESRVLALETRLGTTASFVDDLVTNPPGAR
jgi:hypothetical protein